VPEIRFDDLFSFFSGDGNWPININSPSIGDPAVTTLSLYYSASAFSAARVRSQNWLLWQCNFFWQQG